MSYPTPETVYERICWSADVKDVATLRSTLEQMPDLEWVKIDQLFTKRDGFEVVKQLSDDGYSIFSDEKITEIPSKLEAIAQVLVRYQPAMLNCMAGCVSSGKVSSVNADLVDGLKRFADVCHGANVLPCGVTVLTSKKPRAIGHEFNGRDSIEQVLYYVDMLDACGFTDIVCSTDELEAVMAEFPHLHANVPGIRPAGASIDDQARVATPSGALLAGAERLVIGRPLTNGNPAENLQKIVDEILNPERQS